MKVEVRASVEKGVMISQKHGEEGKRESQSKWNQIQIQFHEALFTDDLLLFTCYWCTASFCPLHPHREKKGFAWAEVMGEGSSKEERFDLALDRGGEQ